MIPRSSFIVATLVAATTPSLAGGLILPVRGIRTLERAGAFIAGADDADALWLDPAGLAHVHGAGAKAVLFDVAYVYQPAEYTPVGGTAVKNLQPGNAPIPTLAAALAVDDRFTLAGGITSPYVGFHRYASDGPQRLASVGTTGSAFYVVTLGAAMRASDTLRIGATVQNIVSTVDYQVALGMCPGTSACAPDDRSYESLANLEQTDYLSPTGSLGVQWDAHSRVTLGLAVQGPARVAGSGSLTFALPSNAIFDNATLSGDHASVGFTLPPIVRAGVELRPTASLRVEAAVGVELWSLHDEITIAPDNIVVDNVAPTGSYTLSPVSIARDYQTSFAPSLGFEYHGNQLMLGAGVGYETAAAPRSHVSVLTIDAPKLVLGLGGGYESDGWQIGGAIGYVAVSDVDVSLADARVVALQPLRMTPTADPVNAGHYESSYFLVGLRAARRL